jgi:hypothetical protein
MKGGILCAVVGVAVDVVAADVANVADVTDVVAGFGDKLLNFIK